MGFKPRSSSSEPKTRPTDVAPRTFLAGLTDTRRRESELLIAMLGALTGEPPVMWGPSIIGFGSYHYRYASGREGDWPRIGFSPRKQALTLYCMPGFSRLGDLLARLGPHTTGASCLYIRRLDDVDGDALRAILARSVMPAS